MYKYLSLSRAARLVGIKRGTLQKRIQAGDISTFEGEVSVAELLNAYPQTDLEDSTMIEHTRKIKDDAVGKIYRDDAVMPSSEILLSRLNRLSAELSEITVLKEHYHGLLEQLAHRLGAAEDPAALLEWLTAAMDAPIRADDGSSRLFAKNTYLRLMSAHVRILPSGHDFFDEGHSSLLEAGLRAGLALDYACSNGNCGRCRARLVSGEIERTGSQDYVFSEAGKASGEFLMCCNRAVSDVVIEAVEASGVGDIQQQSITARVKKVEFPNDDVALVHLKTPRTNRLRFLAGQFVNLQGDGEKRGTDISIASCPCDDMNLHFQVPRDDSEFSRHVFAGLANGDSVQITGPAGDFVLDESSFNSLAFIACNTGFAPVKSLIEHAMALDVAESMHLFWITADAGDRYMHNLCRSWADALDNFSFHPIDSDLVETDAAGSASNDVIAYILGRIDAIDNYDFYVAGNNAITGSCRSALLEKGIDPGRLKVDNLNHD